MKRYGNLFEKICGFANLLRAYKQASRCKRYRPYTLGFTYDLEANLLKLQHELLNQAYRHGSYHEFYVYDPKMRKISAAPFRDRVVHHAFCNVIEPIFDRIFIYDSYACRVGKGAHAVVDRLTEFLRERERERESNVGGDFYAFKCDIRKYFASIDHKILLELIMHKIKGRETLWLINEILRSNNTDCGIPIGNLTSQLFANIYLNKLDHFVKEELRIRHYIRYVDDFVILEDSKKALHNIKKTIRDFLTDNLRLALHPKKQIIFPARLGIDFLGYRVWRTHRMLRKDSVRRMRRKLRKFARLYSAGVINLSKIRQSLVSWLGHARHADTYNLRRRLFLNRDSGYFSARLTL
ncbi:MAG: reverse transcriptase domain-containing protein [Candidatus Omnitrophota bacterium]